MGCVGSGLGRVLAALCALVLTAAGTVHAEPRMALVIGNGGYAGDLGALAK